VFLVETEEGAFDAIHKQSEGLLEGLVEAWGAATLEERHQLLTMVVDAVYVDMAQGLVLGLEPKPEFLPLFNLGELVTTGDAELVTGELERSPSAQKLTCLASWLMQMGSITS